MLLDKKFIFIIGAPRSGTTWLQMMLSSHPLVCSTFELTLFNRYIPLLVRSWNEDTFSIERINWPQGLPLLWSEDDFFEFLKDFLKRVYESLLATNPKASHIVEKQPLYSECVRYINRLLPNARFIHIIRDGRDVALSMVANPHVQFSGNTVTHASALWKKYVKAAQKARQYNDRYLEVRYEDLSISGADVLSSVFDFCGLQATKEDIAEIVDKHHFERMKARNKITGDIRAPDGFYRKGKIGDWKQELHPKQLYLIDKIAGDLLIDLKYAQDGWWAKSRIQAFTVALSVAVSARLKKLKKATSALMPSNNRPKKPDLL